MVSGGARGVDVYAHKGALEQGGSTIIVAPQGLGSYRLLDTLAALRTDSNILILSHFARHTPWSVAAAMARNRAVLSLAGSAIAFIKEYPPSGGTRNFVATAKRMGKPLEFKYYDPIIPELGEKI